MEATTRGASVLVGGVLATILPRRFQSLPLWGTMKLMVWHGNAGCVCPERKRPAPTEAAGVHEYALEAMKVIYGVGKYVRHLCRTCR